MKAHFHHNDVSDINLNGSSEWDDQQDYNRPSKVMLYSYNSGKKHLHGELFKKLLGWSAEVGESFCNRFIAYLLKQSKKLRNVFSYAHKSPRCKLVRQLKLLNVFWWAGFWQKQLKTVPKENYVLYAQNAVAVLRNKVRQTTDEEIMFDCREAPYQSHRVNADTGVKPCTAAAKPAKSGTKSSASWRTTERDGLKSAVGCLQIIGKKIQTSLPAGGMQLYLLYATFQKFTEHARR